MNTPIDNVLLETERLLLRRFTPADVEHLVELDSDPEVMRFLTGGVSTPRAVIEEKVLPRVLTYDEQYPGYGFWAAIEKATGAFVGWFSFRPTDEATPRDVELGFRLRRAAWGKGYATEGARALIDLGFSELGVDTVGATTYEENIGSRRVMEKLGMRLVRTFHMSLDELQQIETLDPTTHQPWAGDDVEYLIKKDEWDHTGGSPRATE